MHFNKIIAAVILSYCAGTFARETSVNSVSEVTGSQNDAFAYGLERRANTVKRSDENTLETADDELDAVTLAKKGKRKGGKKSRKGKLGRLLDEETELEKRSDDSVEDSEDLEAVELAKKGRKKKSRKGKKGKGRLLEAETEDSEDSVAKKRDVASSEDAVEDSGDLEAVELAKKGRKKKSRKGKKAKGRLLEAEESGELEKREEPATDDSEELDDVERAKKGRKGKKKGQEVKESKG